MSLFEIVGNVGGIQPVFTGIFAIILSYYAEISFMIDAINHMHAIKSNDKSLIIKDKVLKISFCDRIKLITNLGSNKKMKKFIDKGYEKMDSYLDLLKTIK